MKYDLDFEVPVKYLGSDVINLISKLSPKDASEIKTIPVKASLNGSFSNPSFSTNIKEATTNLIKDLVEKQKQNLIDESRNKLKDFLGIDPTKKDTTQEEDVKDKIKDILGGLFGRKKDTTKSKN
jgi:nitrogenase molybdenum-iron protein alpha/beta subunit